MRICREREREREIVEISDIVEISEIVEISDWYLQSKVISNKGYLPSNVVFFFPVPKSNFVGGP